MKKPRKVYVMDTTAFIAGSYALSLNSTCFTTNYVVNELKDKESYSKLEAARIMGKLLIKDPSENSLSKIKEISYKLGMLHKLSKADLSILALSYELKKGGYEPIILTDDYSVMNIAKELNLEFKPLRTKGITKVARLIKYCPACGRTFRNNITHCPICGSKLRSKLLKKS